MKRLLFAYDNSECSLDALRELPNLGLPGGLDVRVVCAADIWMPYDDRLTIENEGSLPQSIQKARARAREYIEAYGELAAHAASEIRRTIPSWNVRAVVSIGPPASVILKNATDWRAELIVLGSHCRGPVGRFIRGSVAQLVVERAECPVRVIRRKGQTEGASSGASGMYSGHGSSSS